jgi:hypothetical protein
MPEAKPARKANALQFYQAKSRARAKAVGAVLGPAEKNFSSELRICSAGRLAGGILPRENSQSVKNQLVDHGECNLVQAFLNCTAIWARSSQFAKNSFLSKKFLCIFAARIVLYQ